MKIFQSKRCRNANNQKNTDEDVVMCIMVQKEKMQQKRADPNS